MIRSKLFFISLVIPLMALVFSPGLSFAMGSKGGFIEPQGDKKDKAETENSEEGETRSIEKKTDDAKEEESSPKKKRRLKYMEEGS